MITRFYFEDRGQDCLWWDVEHEKGDAYGKVVDAGLQAWLWANGKFHVSLEHKHGKGALLVTTDDLQRSIETGYCRTWNYPVRRVERRKALTGRQVEFAA